MWLKPKTMLGLNFYKKIPWYATLHEFSWDLEFGKVRANFGAKIRPLAPWSGMQAGSLIGIRNSCWKALAAASEPHARKKSFQKSAHGSLSEFLLSLDSHVPCNQSIHVSSSRANPSGEHYQHRWWKAPFHRGKETQESSTKRGNSSYVTCIYIYI